jgi:energy-converting hydrogenase Eha subunit E
LRFKVALEHLTNALLLGGLIAVIVGTMLWILGLMRTYEVSLEAEIAFIGVSLMILGFVVAKLFSKD